MDSLNLHSTGTVLPQTRGPKSLHWMLFITAGPLLIRKYCNMLKSNGYFLKKTDTF